MNLTQKTTHEAATLTVLTEPEILQILAEAVAAKAGMSLDDANVTVRTKHLTRSSGSLTSAFTATIEIVRDLSAPPLDAAANVTLDYLADAICSASAFRVQDGKVDLNVCTYVDHQKMPHAMRSVVTMEDGRPWWEISKDGTIRVGDTTHLPDGPIRHDGNQPATFGPA